MPPKRLGACVGTRGEVLPLLDPQPTEAREPIAEDAPRGVVAIVPQGAHRVGVVALLLEHRQPLGSQPHEAVVRPDAPKEEDHEIVAPQEPEAAAAAPRRVPCRGEEVGEEAAARAAHQQRTERAERAERDDDHRDAQHAHQRRWRREPFARRDLGGQYGM